MNRWKALRKVRLSSHGLVRWEVYRFSREANGQGVWTLLKDLPVGMNSSHSGELKLNSKISTLNRLGYMRSESLLRLSAQSADLTLTEVGLYELQIGNERYRLLGVQDPEPSIWKSLHPSQMRNSRALRFLGAALVVQAILIASVITVSETQILTKIKDALLPSPPAVVEEIAATDAGEPIYFEEEEEYNGLSPFTPKPKSQNVVKSAFDRLKRFFGGKPNIRTNTKKFTKTAGAVATDKLTLRQGKYDSSNLAAKYRNTEEIAQDHSQDPRTKKLLVVFDRMYPQFRNCYERVLIRHSSMTAIVKIEVGIKSSGRMATKQVRVTNSIPQDAKRDLSQCLSRVIRSKTVRDKSLVGVRVARQLVFKL